MQNKIVDIQDTYKVQSRRLLGCFAGIIFVGGEGRPELASPRRSYMVGQIQTHGIHGIHGFHGIHGIHGFHGIHGIQGFHGIHGIHGIH